MDIRGTIISAKVVIESLIALLENENVDISSVKFKINNTDNGHESNSLSFKSLVEITLRELEIAKTQKVVPEGFVLVPRELPEEIAEAMALEHVEKPLTETNPTWIKISEDTYKGRLQSKKWEFWRNYKAMIEAQEQVG